MSYLSGDGKYAIVEKGDCLSVICKKHLGNGGSATYTKVAKYNGIATSGKKAWLIFPGDHIYLYGPPGSSAPSTTSTPAKDPYKPSGVKVGFIADSTSEELYALWNWTKLDGFENFEYEWQYTVKETGTKWWTSTGTTKDDVCSWSVPDNAEKIQFRVKPVSKTKTEEKNGKTNTTVYFEGKWSDYASYNIASKPPSKPDAPSARLDTLNKQRLIVDMPVESIDATHVQFQIVKNNTIDYRKSKQMPIDATALEYNNIQWLSDLDLGGVYKVRCRVIKGSLESAWSDYASSDITTAPSRPAGFETCEAHKSNVDGKLSVYLKWPAVPSATSYEVEYATNRDRFDAQGQTTSLGSTDKTSLETYSLETGQTYYFRYRAKNSGGESDWSDISDGIALGTAPAAPTIWSSTTTAAVDDPLTLYWVHNSKDGSSQTTAFIEVKLYRGDVCLWNDSGDSLIEVRNNRDLDDIDKTSSYDDLQSYLAMDEDAYETYKDGCRIEWRVKTAGVTGDADNWSDIRVIDIHAKPSIELEVKDGAENIINGTPDDPNTLRALPINVSATTRPSGQWPIGFHLSIVSNESYETVDNFGNDKMVSVGEEVYSKYVDGNILYNMKISAGDLSLESGASYTLTCVASMDSGLTAEASIEFIVEWEEVSYVPNAVITYDKDLMVTHIRPYCYDRTITYYEVEDNGDGTYASTDTLISVFSPEPLQRFFMANGVEAFQKYDEDTGAITYYYLDGTNEVLVDESRIASTEYVYTETGERVCSALTGLSGNGNGASAGGESRLVCERENKSPVEDVLLSVYRREFDGSFTELARDIDNTKNTYITDPHPALDYARYRIVAETQSTGAIGYYDMPGFYVGEKSIIIQWDEDWTSFDMAGDDMPAQPPWSGSLVKLPYNIDVSDSYGMDVSLVEYAGRKRPVSYYGTQLGESSTWNTVIPKDDEETLYALRRLAIWTGDAYVREPSGTGYWANVSVSFNQKHRDLTIPVTLSIKRVEGGA